MILPLATLFQWVFSLFLLPLIFHLLGTGLVLLLIVAAFSPFESLGWWAGWFGHPADQEQATVPMQETTGIDDRQESAQTRHYLVYLSGIGAISGDYLEPAEIAFCERLAARFPGTAVVHDVFPYAMNNRGLTGQRLLTNLINIRNMFQVVVSADLRYGPIYNYGTAEVIRDGLLRRGYRLGSGRPVTIIGYSGGGQIALGAATYLKPMLAAAPLRIISLGGVMADDPGLDRIAHLYHLYGTKDSVQKIGQFAYAGR